LYIFFTLSIKPNILSKSSNNHNVKEIKETNLSALSITVVFWIEVPILTDKFLLLGLRGVLVVVFCTYDQLYI
jgi:hypothetical protein